MKSWTRTLPLLCVTKVLFQPTHHLHVQIWHLAKRVKTSGGCGYVYTQIYTHPIALGISDVLPAKQ